MSNQHGKTESSHTNLFLIEVNGERQTWTSDEYDAAAVVLSDLQDAINNLSNAKSNLPSSFDTRDVEDAIQVAEEMANWYEDAIDSAQEI